MCDEEELLTGALQLDPGAVALIHDRFYDSIYRYARYRTGDGQLAEDTASEVFLRLLDAMQNGKGPSQSLQGWLFGTASHIVNDHLRLRYRIKDEDLGNHEVLSAGIESDPEHRLQQSQTHEKLHKALNQLTPDQQHVVTLRFGQGMSHREVAKITGKSEGAVKLLQFRAMQALRRFLEPT